MKFVAKLVFISATLYVPATAASASVEAPPIALVASGQRVEDANKALCLRNLPSVAGIVCVDKEWRGVSKNTLNKEWLARIRLMCMELLCAQMEEIDGVQQMRVMGAFKAQFLVSRLLIFDGQHSADKHASFAGGNCSGGRSAPSLAHAAGAALLIDRLAHQSLVTQLVFGARAKLAGHRPKPLLYAQLALLCARRPARRRSLAYTR